MNPVRLVRIPNYRDYRLDVIFNAYKWDPQIGDTGTVAPFAAVIGRETAEQLGMFAEQLAAETVSMELELMRRPELAAKLDMPRKLRRFDGYDPGHHVRLMRFDLHPTSDGWALSEVNSDVPGGLAEASVMPAIAASYLGRFEPAENTANALFTAFRGKIERAGEVAFVHATSYSDDRQVMQFLSDHFAKNGVDTTFAAPDHVRFNGGKASLNGSELAAIVRFFPMEWIANMRMSLGGWQKCITPSCNHASAILAQSKRLPLIWDELGIGLTAWKTLLPKTIDPKAADISEDWVLKPAFGRVGEGVYVHGATSEKESVKIARSVKLSPGDWVAQRRFESLALSVDDGSLHHLCIGVFTVDGKRAGLYGRLSPKALIDSTAADIPILIGD